MVMGLQAWADERGYRVAWGSSEVVSEAKADIARLRDSGELDPGFFDTELASEVFPEEPWPSMNAVMIAVPRPAHRVTFDLGVPGKLEAILPPTYFRYQTTFEDVRQDLATNGLPGSRVEHLQGPHKAIAARLGLVRYGRNNITYAPGTGSYLQLRGYWTDAELPERAEPAGPALMPECEGCDRCRKVCPTKAIGEDRMLLRAQQCLTYANENPGEWPEWAGNAPHRCLVGCLLCQRVCPANPSLPVEDTGLSFSSEETKALLEAHDALPPALANSVRKKLAWLGPIYLGPILGRNLAALVKARSVSSS
jgi:epoxyqueuosine reductase